MRLSDQKEEIAYLYFEQGWPYQAIADRYGKSREAVRVFLNRHFPGREPGLEFRKRMRDGKRASRKAEERDAPPCVICSNPVKRKRTSGQGNWSCCHDHSVLWSRARFLLDDEVWDRQIRSTVQSILRYPNNHKKREVAWAKRVSSGEVEPRRRSTRRDSRSRRAYDEVMRIREVGGHEC